MADLKTTVSELPENKVSIEIEVPAEELKASIDRTIKEMGKEVKMPGFRPGKAPREILVRRFGKDAVYAHTLEDAVPGWLENAMMQEGIKPVSRPELELNPIEDEAAAYSFKATVDIIPRPELGQYTGVEAEKEVVEVTDADVEEQIEALRTRLATLQTTEGRPAKEGDYVLIDFTGYVDGEPLEGGAGKDYMLELGSKQFIPGFEDQIAGMEIGQSKKLELSFPEEYQPEHLAGKDVKFDVELKEIKERLLPEANDEFAAENSEHETIAALRQELRDRLQDHREQEAEALFQQTAINNIVDEAKLELPPAAIASRAHELEMDFIGQLNSRGVSPEMYMKQSEENKQEFQDHFMKRAEAELRREAVLETVADIEKLEATDAEIEEEIRGAAERMGEKPDKLVKSMREKGRFGIVRDDILRRKAAEHITSNAIPVPKKAKAVTEEKEEEETKVAKP
jgi:trigger factor